MEPSCELQSLAIHRLLTCVSALLAPFSKPTHNSVKRKTQRPATLVSISIGLLLARRLEHRAQAHPDELSSLLSECHAAYFSTRKALLVPRILEEIKGLDPTRTELVELVRVSTI